MESKQAPEIPDKKVQIAEGLKWQFTDKAITAWGGLRLMKELMIRMGLSEMLSASGMPEPESNRGYNPVVMMESFLVCVWIGGIRFSHTAIVRFDEALREIFGWKKVASVSTFTRFFARFKQPDVDRIFGHINEWFWKQMPSRTVTLDFDSSVLTRYGEQEGVEVGYNPRKHGRPSHHPLFAFVADVRMVLHAWLRAGNANTSNGFLAFFEESTRLLGERHKIGLVRADNGFFVGKFFDMLEDKVLSFVIAAKMNPVIRSMIGGLKNWLRVDHGIEVTEMIYQAQKWRSPRRIIVIRQKIQDRPEAVGRTLINVPGYRVQALVTNLTLPPVEIWRLYRGRADAENRIEELKYDFGMNGFCLDSFYGTEAAFRTVLLAYNLMSVFRQAILKAPQAVRLSTMRFHCFALGSWLGKKARNKVLHISLNSKRRPWFDGLFSRLEALSSPWPLPT